MFVKLLRFLMHFFGNILETCHRLIKSMELLLNILGPDLANIVLSFAEPIAYTLSGPHPLMWENELQISQFPLAVCPHEILQTHW